MSRLERDRRSTTRIRSNDSRVLISRGLLEARNRSTRKPSQPPDAPWGGDIATAMRDTDNRVRVRTGVLRRLELAALSIERGETTMTISSHEWRDFLQLVSYLLSETQSVHKDSTKIG